MPIHPLLQPTDPLPERVGPFKHQNPVNMTMEQAKENIRQALVNVHHLKAKAAEWAWNYCKKCEEDQ